MNGNTHTTKRAITGFALAAAVAAFVVSSALASGGNSLTHTDGSAALMERHFKHEDSRFTKTASTPSNAGLPAWALSTGTVAASSQTGPSSQCPCNLGLVGGPRVSIPAAGSSTVASSQTRPSSQCPCNLGLVGGPRVSVPVAGSSTAVIHPRGGGFDWNDVGAGAGAAFGLALIALAVGTVRARARKDSKMNRDWNIKKRRRLARALERAAVPERPFIGRGPRYIVQPEVAVACAPSLRAIAAALRDETLVVDSGQLEALQRFISDGDSPFFGDETTEALRELVRLQHNIVRAEPAVLESAQSTVAA